MCGTESASAVKKRGCGLDRSNRGRGEGGVMYSVQILDPIDFV
jgi:hypothetical protein